MWLTVVAGSFQRSSVLQGQGADCAVTQRGASELSGFWPEMEGKKERWGREQMKSRSLFSWFPPCWVASDSWIPLLLTLALLKTVVNLIPLYFRVLGKEADRTGNSLAVVLSLMVSLNLTLVNNVSINKLCSKYLIFFFSFLRYLILAMALVSHWDPEGHNGYAFSSEDAMDTSYIISFLIFSLSTFI